MKNMSPNGEMNTLLSFSASWDGCQGKGRVMEGEEMAWCFIKPPSLHLVIARMLKEIPDVTILGV